VQLEDRFYNDIALPSESQYARKQKVQLVGDAQWKNAKLGKVVHSCDGETVSVEVELKVRSRELR
jgi:nucleoporin POM152